MFEVPALELGHDRAPLQAPLMHRVLTSYGLEGFGSDLGPVTALAWSPDGRVLASAHRWVVALWDAQAGHGLSLLNDHPLSLTTAVSSPSDLDINPECEATVRALRFEADGKRLHATNTLGCTLIWDTNQTSLPRPIARLRAALPERAADAVLQSARRLAADVVSAAVDDTGGVLAIGYADDRTSLARPARVCVSLWNNVTQTSLGWLEVDNPDGATEVASHLAFAPKTRTLAVGTLHGWVCLWRWQRTLLN